MFTSSEVITLLLNGSLCLHPVQPIFGTAFERDPWRMVRYVYIAIRAALATL